MSTSDGSVYWALPEADARHLASFELAAAVAEVLPVAFFLEVDELDGHYDTLWLNLAADRGPLPNGPHIKIVRQGRVWIHADSRSVASADPVDALAPVSRGADPDEQAARVVAALGTDVVVPTPGAARHALRFMHEVLQYAVEQDARVPWRWRPSSEHRGHTAADHHAQVPPALDATAGVDPLEQRFWRLLRGDNVVLTVDVSADAPSVLLGDATLPGLGKASRKNALTAVRAALPKYRATLPAHTSGAETSTMSTARRAYAATAQHLAREVAGGSVNPFIVPSRLTSFAGWFTAGPEHLLVVMGPHEDPRDAVTLLAYALAWQSQRTLHLVLPPGFADPVLRLLPWIRTPVRIHISAPDGLRTLTVPARDEVLTAVRALPEREIGEHDLGDRDSWLSPLLAEVLPLGLSAQHRPTYQSWTYSGRSVLQVSRTKGGGLAVRAGINYTKPKSGQPAPVTLNLSGPVTDADLAVLCPAVVGAIAARQQGVDADDREHQLQASLAAHGLPGLDALFFHREYPAWRSRRRPGFIDFLAATHSGDLDVVETKIGGDCAVALQALEYWIWASANSTVVRARGGWPTDPTRNRHRMTLVLAKDTHGRAYDRYLYGVLEAIAGDVPWRVLLAELPTPTGAANESSSTAAVPTLPAVTPLASSQTPQALLAGTEGEPPCAPPRWVAVTSGALPDSATSAASDGRFRPDYHPRANAAFGPEALIQYDDLKKRGLLHSYVLHRRSSRAFALNLFAPLGDAGLRAVLTDVGIDDPGKITCRYEWSAADHELREGRPNSPHATQIDVRIDCLDSSASRVAVLGEVKFTEDGFGECSAFTSGANPWRDVCRTSGMFGDQPERCWMLRNHTRSPEMRTRAYLDLLAERQVSAPPPLADDGGCWVRRGRSQPMRNLALAEHLISSHQADQVLWVLVAPAGHEHAWTQLDEVRQVFPSTSAVEVLGLQAEMVARAHPDGGAALHVRYPMLRLDT